jgi:hypothetical protein
MELRNLGPILRNPICVIAVAAGEGQIVNKPTRNVIAQAMRATPAVSQGFERNALHPDTFCASFGGTSR